MIERFVLADQIEVIEGQRNRVSLTVTPTIELAVLCYDKGQGNRMHRHPGTAQTLLTLQGRGVVQTRDGDEMGMEPGVAVLIPEGQFYRLENTGDEPLVMYQVVRPIAETEMDTGEVLASQQDYVDHNRNLDAQLPTAK